MIEFIDKKRNDRKYAYSIQEDETCFLVTFKKGGQVYRYNKERLDFINSSFYSLDEGKPICYRETDADVELAKLLERNYMLWTEKFVYGGISDNIDGLLLQTETCCNLEGITQDNIPKGCGLYDVYENVNNYSKKIVEYSSTPDWYNEYYDYMGRIVTNRIIYKLPWYISDEVWESQWGTGMIVDMIDLEKYFVGGDNEFWRIYGCCVEGTYIQSTEIFNPDYIAEKIRIFFQNK